MADAGLGKADVRRLSRLRACRRGTSPPRRAWRAASCTACPVTAERLSRIECAEWWLRARLGPSANIRVRDHGDTARVEVNRDLVPTVAALVTELQAVGPRLGWDRTRTHVDPEGFRSGNLNRFL